MRIFMPKIRCTLMFIYLNFRGKMAKITLIFGAKIQIFELWSKHDFWHENE